MVGETISDFQGIPLAFIHSRDDNASGKIAHDSYDVYVNKHYVGEKILIAQNEVISEVESYLKNQGFHDFQTNLSGNQYNIRVDDNQSADMKNTLNVYLKIR